MSDDPFFVNQVVNIRIVLRIINLGGSFGRISPRHKVEESFQGLTK